MSSTRSPFDQASLVRAVRELMEYLRDDLGGAPSAALPLGADHAIVVQFHGGDTRLDRAIERCLAGDGGGNPVSNPTAGAKRPRLVRFAATSDRAAPRESRSGGVIGCTLKLESDPDGAWLLYELSSGQPPQACIGLGKVRVRSKLGA